MYNKSLRQRRIRTFAVLVRSSIYFLLDEKYISTTFFEFAPDGKNAPKVWFTLVENHVRRGITVFHSSNLSGSDSTSTFK
jgi:hypothetical protein